MPTIRFRTQDTRASTARKLNSLLVGESDAGTFFRFRETPQTFDQWLVQLEDVRRALYAAFYTTEPIGQFRMQDDRRMLCYRLNRLAEAVDAGAQDIAPTSLLPPVLSGTPETGETLTVTNGTWRANPSATITRRWLRDGVEIVGATGTTYVLVVADEGAEITVEVTATNTEGATVVVTNALGPVVAPGAP